MSGWQPENDPRQQQPWAPAPYPPQDYGQPQEPSRPARFTQQPPQYDPRRHQQHIGPQQQAPRPPQQQSPGWGPPSPPPQPPYYGQLPYPQQPPYYGSPLPRHKRSHKLRNTLIGVAGGVAAIIVIAAAVGSGDHSTGSAATAGSREASVTASPATNTWSALAATVKGCRDLAAWENGNSTVRFSQDPQSQVILNESAGTDFASDLRTWMDDGSDWQAAMTDANTVDADCAAAGVPRVIGSG